MPFPGQMPPAALKGPSIPGSITGGPSGPGASPVMSPGGGAGNEAMADAAINAAIPSLHRALGAYAIGSKKYNGVLNAIRALTANFGKEHQESMVPAALLQMSQAAKRNAPLPGSPPPPMAPGRSAPPPGLPPVGTGGMEEMTGGMGGGAGMPPLV